MSAIREELRRAAALPPHSIAAPATFPETGPILIITDGECDVLRVKREHAFLLPQGHSPPFVPQGRVFYVA